VFVCPYAVASWKTLLGRAVCSVEHLTASHQWKLFLSGRSGSTCRYVVPRQRQFRADLAVVNECLDELILLAKRTQQPEDIEALQQRDYTKVDTAPAGACTVTGRVKYLVSIVQVLQLRPKQAG
jgi:hypothetical protein